MTKSLIDYNFEKFQKLNPHAEIIHEGDEFIIKELWLEERINFCISTKDQETIDLLNKIKIIPKYDAIFYVDENRIEFLLGFIPEEKLEQENHFSHREFNLDFNELSIKCKFDKPSDSFWSLAKIFTREPGPMPDAMTQMSPFSDFLRMEDLPERIQRFFENRVPINFHITDIKINNETNFEQLFSHINILFHYYDRKSVIIQIRKDQTSEKEDDKPKNLELVEGHFPSHLAITNIDDIILQLLDTARESSTRMKFLYYYQVIEYSSHTYIDESVKTKLRKQLRDPSIVTCSDDKIAELFNTIIDLNHHDDVKIKKVVEDYTDPELLWRELELNKEFFSSITSFEGGFVLNPLIADSTDLNSWKTMWHPKLIDSITKIRNCIVHARERRENKVILPSSSNNKKLEFYTLLIERIAESIALKHT